MGFLQFSLRIKLIITNIKPLILQGYILEQELMLVDLNLCYLEDFRYIIVKLNFRRVAQRLEHHLDMVVVGGSIPLVPIN